MIGTYVSAALICVASLLVGRALLLLAGRDAWSWLEPAVGLAAVLTVTGILARAPGHGTSATVGLALLLLAAGAIVFHLRPPADGPKADAYRPGSARRTWRRTRRGSRPPTWPAARRAGRASSR